MEVEEINRLKEAKVLGKCYTLLRPKPFDDDLLGVPVTISETLILFKVISDFHFDGFAVWRLEDIEEIQHSEFEEFREKVLKDRGLLTPASRDSEIFVNNWWSILSGLTESSAVICIEYQSAEGVASVLGKINSLDRNQTTVQSFNEIAEWEEEEINITLDDILSLYFGYEYATTFDDYLPKICKTR